MNAKLNIVRPTDRLKTEPGRGREMAGRQVCGHSAALCAGGGRARLNGQEIEPHNKTLLCVDKRREERERETFNSVRG